MVNPNKIECGAIDCSAVDGYSLTLEDVVVSKLKEDGFFGRDFLYSGFSAENLQYFLKHGTYRSKKDKTPKKSVFCSGHDELMESPSDGSNALWYASITLLPALAVYKKESMLERGCLEYSFKNPRDRLSALAAVYLFKNLETADGFEGL